MIASHSCRPDRPCDFGRSLRVIIPALMALMCLASFSDAQSWKPKKLPPLKIPAWYQTIPRDKDSWLARGREDAADMQLSVDKATLVARVSLASILESQWQDLLLTLRKEMTGVRDPAYTKDEATLSGTTVRFQKVVKRGKIYTAFVLVALPKSACMKALRARAHEDGEWFEGVKESRVIKTLETETQ